ncbi:MAG: sugar phosphate isomerase/epimerase [Anaerolineae bacterium]
MTTDIALSTMWAIGRFSSLEDFFQAGNALGFRRFELNHGIDSAMLAGLRPDVSISSVHEPCPADVSLKELGRRNWLISATDEENRRQGVLATRRSIDLAHRLGAGVVIVHPGRVDIDPALDRALVDLYERGCVNLPEYARAKARLVAARSAQAEANMRSVRRSLQELAEHAEGLGVRLGLENRIHTHEIPLPDELDELLGLGCGDTLGYWHDVGHAQVLEHLGFYSQEEWLRRFSGQMNGIHFHDVRGVTDHLAAGLGQVDWDLVFAYLPPGAIRTCEFKPGNSSQEVAAGLEFLADRDSGEGA